MPSCSALRRSSWFSTTDIILIFFPKFHKIPTVLRIPAWISGPRWDCCCPKHLISETVIWEKKVSAVDSGWPIGLCHWLCPARMVHHKHGYWMWMLTLQLRSSGIVDIRSDRVHSVADPKQGQPSWLLRQLQLISGFGEADFCFSIQLFSTHGRLSKQLLRTDWVFDVVHFLTALLAHALMREEGPSLSRANPPGSLFAGLCTSSQ